MAWGHRRRDRNGRHQLDAQGVCPRQLSGRRRRTEAYGGHAPGRLGQRRCKGLPPTATKVRRLGEEDWATYRRVRLAALKEAPYAFGSTYAGEVELDETTWRARLRRRPTFVAEVDGTIAGTVATGESDVSGVAALVAMWVDPRFRREGVGDVLVKTAIDWATDHGFSSLFLWVTAVNATAERLYRRNGFVRTGASQDVRPGELEYEMSKRLR